MRSITIFKTPARLIFNSMQSDEKFEASFRKPNPIDRALNRVFGFLVGLGFGLSHNYLLQVRGRKTGQLYSTPVNLLEFKGKQFLVAPRGRTQWVRNVEAANEVILKRGRTRASFRLRPIPDRQKAEILKAYLDRFKLTVQRYFPVPAGSGPEALDELAAHYPVFELLPSDTKDSHRP
jgi:deazaflavin-dependent oxidoreductase (nitroreductase family)